MQLIDALETRSDSVKIFEGIQTIESLYDDEWNLLLDGAEYPIDKDALDTLLNLLRIPIKYVERCVEDVDAGAFLAQESINYWLTKFGDISFLVEDQRITQVFPGKRLYLPGVEVNDLIIEYLMGDVRVLDFVVEDDVFNAVYLTQEKVEVDGRTLTLGVRVLYSDCFTITPRFDGVVVDEDGAVLGWPTLRRKFRVASNTIPQVRDQIEEFLALSLEGLRDTLIPSLMTLQDRHDKLIDTEKFITRLCNDLRLSKKVKDELYGLFEMPNNFPHEIVWKLAQHTARPTENIDLAMGRNIQIALSNWVVGNEFK
jgi:hypothetical protein